MKSVIPTVVKKQFTVDLGTIAANTTKASSFVLPNDFDVPDFIYTKHSPAWSICSVLMNPTSPRNGIITIMNCLSSSQDFTSVTLECIYFN